MTFGASIIKTETLKHKEAFEMYYVMGGKRSIRQLARNVAVTTTTIQNWSRSFNWKERIVLRDNKIGSRLVERSIDEITGKKAQMLSILLKTIADAADGVKAGQLGIQNQTDLVKTIQAAANLIGDQPAPAMSITFNFGEDKPDE